MDGPWRGFRLTSATTIPRLFWTYFVAALNTGVPGVGAGALALLQPPQPPNEAGLVALLNDLDAISDDVVLVLDDYHVIDARDVQDGMAFLLEHLPPRIHLVIASRADPALPLARLRGRGELAEIRAADLRFTPGEAAAYLNEVMGLGLTAPMSPRWRDAPKGGSPRSSWRRCRCRGERTSPAFIAGFAGDDRYIVDFLAEEVLQRQPEHVQQFLLQTSILDRLSGPLCDAVTGQDGGKAKLAALERGNLFLVPLDDRRRWYRYHQLFADVLHARLRDEQPDEVPDLHRRASGWYEQNGEPSEAIRHALAAGDFERAADLVELAIPAMLRTRQEAAVLGWLELLPDEVVRVRPVLSVGFAGALLAGGEFEGVEARLRDAERWLDGATGIRRGIPCPSGGDGRRRRRRNFAASRRRSSCTVPPRPWPGAMGPAPCGTPGGRSNFRLPMTTSAVLRQRHSWGSRPGRAGTSRPGTRGMPSAWRDCGGPGTSPIPSAARSRWRTSGVRKAVSARPCAPTSRPCSVQPSRAGRFCGARQTCT